MRSDGSLVGTRRGSIPAIGPQPRGRHASEVWAGTPTEPWRSRRLPATVLADGPRRTLFRMLLRRAEGVPVRFADGTEGVVGEVVLRMVGFDFWPEALVVATAAGRRLVPAAAVEQIDVREPLIRVEPAPAEPPERGVRFRQEARRREERVDRGERRQVSAHERALPRPRRRRAETPGRGR